jgi:hypothetical protein
MPDRLHGTDALCDLFGAKEPPGSAPVWLRVLLPAAPVRAAAPRPGANDDHDRRHLLAGVRVSARPCRFVALPNVVVSGDEARAALPDYI